MITGKIRSANIKLIFVTAYIVFITLFDVYCYGYIYQQKIQAENYKSTFWQWVFSESGSESGGEHIAVARYRAIQKSIEVAGLIIILYYCGLWAAIGILISHYLMAYDLLFYIILGQTGFFSVIEKGLDPWWLKYYYQAGYLIFNPFKTIYFYISGFAGIIIAGIMCYIPRQSKAISKP